MLTSAGMPRLATGMCGGYSAPGDIVYFVHGTNMREILDKGLPYPTSFVEVRDWLKEGKLTAGSVEVYTAPAPNIACKDGDLFAYASTSKGGWGDPLEREFSLVENDLHYGWITPDVAERVYGVVANGEGKVNVKESEGLRQQMRNRRKERSVDAREWWRNEREQVLRKEFSEDVYNMYADCLKYEKFRRQFMGMWQLPEDYKL
jgi:N-methylhydantoinase B/oxoprolinase/acetone carboxylase alpha subunit